MSADNLLRHCSNPYRVVHKEEQNRLDESEQFQRRVRYILNRLSPDNNNKLTIEFLNLPLDSEERLKECIHLIWSKALQDRIYASLYAKLCKVMSETRIELQFMPDKYISFGTALVKKCQRELNRDYKSRVDMNMFIDTIKRAGDDCKRKQLETDLEALLTQARLQFIGNLIFLAELYKLDMVEDNLVLDGIESLFKRVYEGADENVEFICKLIGLVAPKLKKSCKTSAFDTNRLLDDYVRRLKILASVMKPRLRFAIMDIIEMKNSNTWTLKARNHHQIPTPQRLEDIRVEYELEQECLIKNQTLLDSLSDFDSDSEAALPSIKEMLSFDYAKHVFDEYTAKRDHKHAMKDIASLKSIDIKEFVRDLISIGFYKDSKARSSIGLLIYKCLKSELLNREHFGNGLRLFFNSLKDREEDNDNDDSINYVPAQVAEILDPLFQIDYIRLECLTKAFETIAMRKLGCEILCETLKRLEARLGQNTTLDIFEMSNVDIRKLIENCKNGNDVFKRNNLDWSLKRRQTLNNESYGAYKRSLKRFLKLSSNLDAIISIFSPNEVNSEEFISALVEAVIEDCWLEKSELDTDRFRLKYSEALKDFIDDDGNKELSVLYAVQEYDFKMKQKPDFLKDAFAMFYDEDIVKEVTFWRWQNEPKRKGHEIAKFILRDFFIFTHTKHVTFL